MSILIWYIDLSKENYNAVCKHFGAEVLQLESIPILSLKRVTKVIPLEMQAKYYVNDKYHPVKVLSASTSKEHNELTSALLKEIAIGKYTWSRADRIDLFDQAWRHIFSTYDWCIYAASLFPKSFFDLFITRSLSSQRSSMSRRNITAS